MLKKSMTIFRTSLFLAAMIVSAVSIQAQLDGHRPVHDFMVGNSPLKALELEEAFNGQTQVGFYRFDREALPTHRFEETTAKGGAVKHVQGDEVLTGKWDIKGDQICFVYDEVWAQQLCFDIYRVGNCYYHYLKTEGGNPIESWTARSSLKGERPNCEPNIS